MSETRISKRGYCFEHGLDRKLANNEQLENKAGPFYDHWLRRSYLAMRPALVAMQAGSTTQREVESEA